MTEAEPIIDLLQDALITGVILTLPPLLMALIVGLLVSIFQSITSIQEQTLVFIPKILAVSLTLILFTPWIVASLIDFTIRVFEIIPKILY